MLLHENGQVIKQQQQQQCNEQERNRKNITQIEKCVGLLLNHMLYTNRNFSTTLLVIVHVDFRDNCACSSDMMHILINNILFIL